MIKLTIRPSHDCIIHSVLHLQHDRRYVMKLFHGSSEESVGKEGMIVALDGRRKLLVVTC